MNERSWLVGRGSKTEACRGWRVAGLATKHDCLAGVLLLTLLAAWVWLLATPALAQTQPNFDIQAGQPNLEQEYRDELDKWMLRAYEGDRDAQFKVGVLFTNDQFGPPDFEQAVYWYKQAARQDHVLAQYNLGHQYLTGVGVKKNEEAAMKWWLEAAKQDHALAQFNVGRAFYLGIGLQEDHTQSKYWFERAARNQEPKSIDILKQLGWYDSDLIPQQPAESISNNSELVAGVGPVDVSGQAVTQRQTAPPSGLTSKIVPIASPEQAPSVPVEPTAVVEAAPVEAAPVIQTAATAPEKDPIALYTDPSVRSVLIAILDQRSDLKELSRTDVWATVESDSGFPVWVHGDFINISGKQGTITGQDVNARSVPIVTNGTVVGKLKKDETVAILDERKGWYRVTAPQRFQAWVKVLDMDKQAVVSTDGGWSTTTVATNAEPAAPAAEAATQANVLTTSTTAGDSFSENDWMFQQPANRYTLQLASFDDLAKVKEFESRGKFRGNPELHRFTAKGKNIEWTYFLYGSYADKESAEAAKVDIKQKLAWVRTFGRLQQNRCVAWKTQLPTPPELNRYCTQ